jgi:integrase
MKKKNNPALHKVQAVALHPRTPATERAAARRAIARIEQATPKTKPGRAVYIDSAVIRRLVDGDGPAIRWDDDVKARGFGVRKNAGGSITFFFNYRDRDGRERRVSIGPYPRWTLGQARARARELRKEIDRGDDPAGDRQERREAPTIADLIDRYLRDHLPRKAASTHGDDKTMLKEIAKYLGRHSRVAEINHGDVADMHRRISESKGRRGRSRTVRANRILSLTSKLFSLSLVPQKGEVRAWRAADVGNPCAGVPRNSEQGCERYFTAEEMASIFAALDEYGAPAADAVRLVAYTGCRPGEAMQAEWSEFDAEPGYWVKPSAHTKQRKVHKLPLSPPALALIEWLRQHRGKNKNLFGRPGRPLSTLHHVWAVVRKKTGIGSGRLYDLRHSVASIGADEGLSLVTVGGLLGHASPKTTARYVHLYDTTLREAADKIGSRIADAKARSEARS